MVQTSDLFEFPTIMIDGDKEEEREEMGRNLGLPTTNESDPEIIIGSTRVPHWDFLFVKDRWNLTEESYQRALKGKFDCCIATFDQCGSFIVPLTAEKFLKRLDDFRSKLPTKPHFNIINVSDEILEKLKHESNISKGDSGLSEPSKDNTEG